jgi:uncharacterized membrane protein YuzA (DUF378 family)
MKAEKVLCTVALVLVIVGALNWGLEAFGYNVVNLVSDGIYKLAGSENLSGKKTNLEIAVYVLVAAAGLAVAVQMGRKKIAACPDDDEHQS